MTERLRFSTLKSMALSPRHLAHAMRTELEPSRAMRIGTATHSQLLGGNVVVFDGTRRGKAWDAFKAEHAGSEIVTADEMSVAAETAIAVRTDPVAGPMFVGPGTNETRIDWDFRGVPFRSTPDRIVGTTLIELKTTRDAYPDRFIRDATRRHYHAQCAVYREALRQHGATIDRVVIVAVETFAPYAVTVVELDETALDVGLRTACLWLERYRICRDSNEWPGYSQAPIRWEIHEEPALDFGDETETDQESEEAA